MVIKQIKNTVKKVILILLFPLLIFSQENNHSMYFGDGDNFVKINNFYYGPLQDNTFSIVLWVKGNFAFETDNAGTIISKYANGDPTNSCFALMTVIDDSNNWSFRLIGNGGNDITFGSCSSDQWQMVSIIFNNGQIDMYTDTLLEQSSPSGSLDLADNIGNMPLSFGIINNDESTYNDINDQWETTDDNQGNFVGYIDNVSIWNTNLSEEEIIQLYNCPPEGTESGLVGYWNFEEGENDQGEVLDLSINQNHGTISIDNQSGYTNDTPSQNCLSNEETSIIGDVNCDGNITIDDLQLLSNIWNDLVNPDTLDLPCPQNSSEITNESIEALQEIVDVLSNSTNNIASRSGFDIRFPDGYIGENITWDFNIDGQSYEVPEDKVLYITNFLGYGPSLMIDNESILNIHVNYHIPAYPNGYTLSLPIIAGSNQVVFCPNGDPAVFDGFLIENSQIEPIIKRIYGEGVISQEQIDANGYETSYTVPDGKKLCITQLLSYGQPLAIKRFGDSNFKNLTLGHYNRVANWNLEGSSGNVGLMLNNPIIVNQGDIIKVGEETSANLFFNGYLVDEDYFADDSSGGSSTTNSVNYVDNYTAPNVEIDCDYVDALNIGTTINKLSSSEFFMVINGKKCDDEEGQWLFQVDDSPIDLQARDILWCFTVNDTIMFDNLQPPNVNSVNGGSSIHILPFDLIDSYDPNVHGWVHTVLNDGLDAWDYSYVSGWQYTTYNFIGDARVLLPGVFYILRSGNYYSGSQYSGTFGEVVLTNDDIFNQIAIWERINDTSPYEWEPTNLINHTYGFKFYQFGKTLKIIN